MSRPTGWTAGPISRDTRIHVAGAAGMVGSALVRHLTALGFRDLVTPRSTELDLRDRPATLAFLAATRPGVVIDAAARVGGILANDTSPADFLSDNLLIQVNLMDAALQAGVDRLLFLGSSCIYPRDAPQPITEDSLMTGPLEPTNEAYAVAKIAGVTQVRAVRRQHGRHWISAMPTNLYGPGDNLDLTTSHVLPALVRKFSEAVAAGSDQVVVWGSGTPRREFLHVDDLARACLVLLEHHDGPDPVNVGTGRDLTIAELARMVAASVGYTGAIVQDRSRPDGTPRKVLDVTTLTALGFSARIPLATGIDRMVADVRQAMGLTVGAGAT